MKFPAILLLSCVLTAQPHPATSDLKRMLAEQGFTGELKGKVRFSSLGRLTCNARKLQVLYYEWEESNPPGNAIHSQYRILFLGNESKYVGSYAVDDRPIAVGPDALLFHYEKDRGNKVQCNAHGLPNEVLLNGEPHALFK